jgi:transposase
MPRRRSTTQRVRRRSRRKSDCRKGSRRRSWSRWSRQEPSPERCAETGKDDRRSVMRAAVVDDELWELIQPLLPRRRRRYRHPGRRRIDDRTVLNGILFVLTTGIAWQRLPKELGFGSGMTCWRRLRDWQKAGVFEHLHELLLAKLRQAGLLDLSRAVCDSSSVRGGARAVRGDRAHRARGGTRGAQALTLAEYHALHRVP